MLAANAMWHVLWQRLLQQLLDLQSAGGCAIFMHLETNFVKCTFAAAKLEIDVVCVCGVCGSKHGTQKWLPIQVETICSLPMVGLKSRSKVKSFVAFRRALKDKGWG